MYMTTDCTEDEAVVGSFYAPELAKLTAGPTTLFRVWAKYLMKRQKMVKQVPKYSGKTIQLHVPVGSLTAACETQVNVTLTATSKLPTCHSQRSLTLHGSQPTGYSIF